MKLEKPEMEIVTFEAEDIICTSLCYTNVCTTGDYCTQVGSELYPVGCSCDGNDVD